MDLQGVKKRRHQAILQLVDEKVVADQNDLRLLLIEQGFDVNVATVSRDVRELQIVKSTFKDAEGVLRYRYVREPDRVDGAMDLAKAIDAVVDAMSSNDQPVEAIVFIRLGKRSGRQFREELDRTSSGGIRTRKADSSSNSVVSNEPKTAKVTHSRR